jgi:glycosyltransferase involved in cell wall biosynthesis
MKVAIDAHALGRGQAGYESYLRHLTAALREVAPAVDFLLYRDLAARRIPRLLRDLPRLIRRDRPDLLHMQYAAPIPCRVPLVATIHDLSFEDAPQFFPPLERALLRAAVRRTVRLAARIITVSQFSKERLMAVYGLPAEKIIVAPNAAGPEFGPQPEARSEIPYILMAGDLQPRKNHVRLIQAFAALARRYPHRLKIAGRPARGAAAAVRAARESGAGNRIDFLGYVADAELPALYRGADLCVYPSLYEGFGLPVVEAMASGVPVVCSRIPALMETAGSAAVFADPEDPGDLRAAMEAALADRQRLRSAGLARARRFHWRQSARLTLQAYREACPPRRWPGAGVRGRRPAEVCAAGGAKQTLPQRTLVRQTQVS